MADAQCCRCKAWLPWTAYDQNGRGSYHRSCRTCIAQKISYRQLHVSGFDDPKEDPTQLDGSIDASAELTLDHPMDAGRSAFQKDFSSPSAILPLAFKDCFGDWEILDLGMIDVVCNSCHAWHWAAEKKSKGSRPPQLFESCCKKGSVWLPPWRDLPSYLQQLLRSDEPCAQWFRQQIRQYNAALTFTSVNYGVDQRPSIQRGPTYFQIHGELFHLHGPLQALNNQSPQYAQLFFYDPAYAAAVRWTRNPELEHSILQALTEMLHEINPFIAVYQTAMERLRSPLQSDARLWRLLFTPQLRLILEEGSDQRRENLPARNEMAMVIPDEFDFPSRRDVVLADRRNPQGGGQLWRIHSDHAAYMLLHYVLLFPHGDVGFHWALRLAGHTSIQQRGRLSQHAYYRYRLHLRSTEAPDRFLAGRLFQQYIVDAWACCDQNKLSWIKNHQGLLRSDLYNGLSDAILETEIDARTLGQRIILPSSYTGGDRYMMQLFQDSMAIVRHFGKPTLFITMTANPRWPEIQRALLFGQTAWDRPDLIARVFQMKLAALLHDLRHREVFGRFLGIVWTIEYQKRGLPHVHILLFLHPEDRFMTADRIDQIVSAEFPDPQMDPTGQLTDLIRRTMVHGPCGDWTPQIACRRSNTGGRSRYCSKQYPRNWQEETFIKEDGYPLYRRRSNGYFFTVPAPSHPAGEVTVDSRWVVPYNPYLSWRYQAHINVEVCASVKAIKYIHKYIYKGHDRTTLRLQATTDEVQRYLQGRYIGPSEAIWRLFEYPMHQEYPSVIRLAVHLPGQQIVSFHAQDGRQDLERRMREAKSTLIAFFEYNRLHSDGRSYLYQEFPQHFVFNQQLRRWSPRQQKNAIGRMYHCSPFAGEKYYLRLLLTVRSGPQSFQDLRTIARNIHPTFQQACIELGLLENDREWNLCFHEAGTYSSGSALRSLFVMALTSGNVQTPLALWDDIKEIICDDLPYRLQFQENVPDTLVGAAWDWGLFLIQQTLLEFGKTLEDFHLPLPQYQWQATEMNPLIAAARQYDREKERENACVMQDQLNPAQQEAFNVIVKRIDDTPFKAHFFIQGAGGTGKTFLYRCLCSHYRSQGKIVLCVASSGIAALLLPGGRTSHSCFKIPLSIHELSLCAVRPGSHVAELLQETHLIIWDEVPMQHKHCVMAVHRTLCDLRGTIGAFGGIPVVFGGDFAQILPVISHGSRSAIVKACIQQCAIWPQLTILTLTENMRLIQTQDSQDYARWLAQISYGSETQGMILLPTSVKVEMNISSFCHWVYPPLMFLHKLPTPSWLASHAILT